MMRPPRILALVCLSLGLVPFVPPAAARTAPQGLRAAVEAAVAEAVGDGDVSVRDVAVSDPRPLGGWTVAAVRLLPGERPTGRVTLQATLRRGARTRPVFVLATVAVRVPVWVVQRSLGPGAPLTADVLAVERRPLDRLPVRAIRATAALTGRVAARRLRRGEVLTEAAVTTPRLVRRGDPVQVVVRAGAVSVRSAGTALQTGRLGERVRVRLPSRRVLTGAVRGAGIVEVIP